MAELAIQREAVAKVVMQPMCLASPIFQRQQLIKEVKHVAEQNYRDGTAEQQEDEQLCGCSSVQSFHASSALCTFVTVLRYQFLMAALIEGACKCNMLQQTHMAASAIGGNSQNR